MALRANWTGHLKLSLVSIPIRLYNAISSSNKIAFNQLHKGCNQRLRQQLVCPQHGKVEREDIAKGYEYEKDRYVVIDEADLEKAGTNWGLLKKIRDEKLVLKAPASGVVGVAPDPKDLGRWYEYEQEQNAPFCTINEPQKLRVCMPLTPHYCCSKHELICGLRSLRASVMIVH